MREIDTIVVKEKLSSINSKLTYIAVIVTILGLNQAFAIWPKLKEISEAIKLLQ